MRLHSYLALPLIDSLPLTYADPVYTINLIYVDMDPNRVLYTVNLFKPGQEDHSALCAGDFQSKGLIGEQRMRCLRIPEQTVDLKNELNVRIQQPDDMRPDISGFNTLVDWSGVTSRVNYGGKALKNTPGWAYDYMDNTWKIGDSIPLEQMPCDKTLEQRDTWALEGREICWEFSL